MEELLGSIEEEDLTFKQRGDVYETLLKVLGNIVRNPGELKFRTLKKENRLVADKICRSSGAVSVLLALGFEDTGAAYFCPPAADLAPVSEVVEFLECIIASRSTEEDSSSTATQSTSPLAVTAEVVAASATSPVPARSPASAASPTGQTFARKADAEKKREEQAGQLEAIRAAQRDKFADGGGAAGALRAAAPTAPPATQAPKSSDSSPDAKKKPPVKSAFDFESRAKQEQQQQKASDGLEELRRQQREKFKDFQNDPNAKHSEAYKRPASVAGGGKAEQSWGDWLGGMFGGGSSSGGGGGGGGGGRPSDDRRGPRVKGISDLPKPVRRG